MVDERLPKILAGLAILAGVGVALIGVSVFVDAWQASRAWAGSDAARLAEIPGEAPIWLDVPATPAPTTPEPVSVRPTDAPTPVTPPLTTLPWGPLIPTAPRPPLPRAGEGELPGSSPPHPTLPRTGEAEVEPGPTVGLPLSRARERGAGGEGLSPGPNGDGIPEGAWRASAQDVKLGEVDFRFLDPPEPGAHARLAVTLHNQAAMPTGPVALIVPARWFAGFEVLGTIPSVLDDREFADQPGEGERRFVFESLAPGERQTVELHVTSTGEEIDAPEVRIVLSRGVELSEGDLSDDVEVGRAKPRTVAPRPRPGPARTVAIPRLGVRSAVVPVPWEPPPFVVGQVQGSAAVSLGNTVLIGHLAGPQGDIFARLDRLRPGDEVIAVSRGLEHRFVVSEIAVRPYDDVQPTEPTETPRLTLMTCTGQWSILRQDYSQRLWVVAEPPELAEQTIRANAERAVQAVREAEEAAAARAAHEAEITVDPTPRSPSAPLRRGAGEQATILPPSSQAGEGGQATDSPLPRTGEGDREVVAPAAITSPTPEERAPGLTITAPADGAAVQRRVVVRGRRTPDADPTAPLWLLVRADVPGSRWYSLPRPLEPDEGGAWQAEIELGGAAGIRHEIWIGAADATADALLRRHAVERRGQPLDELPEGFTTGAQVVVERR